MDKDKILYCLSKILETDIEDLNAMPENVILSEIGLDSIKFISFIVELEDALKIEVSDKDLRLDNFETLEKTYKTLQKYFKSEKSENILKKCLILDCDGVLWKGVAGEEAITIDEYEVKFQNELIGLYEKGTLLCLCSKNEQRNISEAFSHPDMVLKKEHVIITKTNSSNKADNIREIAAELNILTDDFVFADDDPYEIGLVNSLMPEVETVNYSEAGAIEMIKSFFGSLPQDINRTQLYKEQKERVKALSLFSSVEEYNASLETKIICDTANINQAARITELSQRTNQFNLAGKHYSSDEIETFIKSEEYNILYLSVSDKYGDMGIVAAAVVKKKTDHILIENFMLSCRVFCRGFEYVLLDKIKQMFDITILSGIFIQNEKNKKHSGFYKDNGVNI